MGRSPRRSKDGFNKGAWTADEDKILTDYIKIHGEGKWSNVAKKTGLRRSDKSCRLRWMNYLRPDIKRGNISRDEEELIIRLHKLLGNRWSLIAGRLPGRTDNEIKNYWNTNLAKKFPHQPSVNSNNDIEKRLKTGPLNINVNEQPSTKPNSLPLPVPDDEENHKNIIIHVKVDGNWPKNTNYETEYSNDLGPMSREDNSSNLIMDFNVDDFCMILDNSDFTKLNDHLVDEEDGKTTQSTIFPEKMEENWRGTSPHESVTTSEFLSMASSFLESADQEWLKLVM